MSKSTNRKNSIPIKEIISIAAVVFVIVLVVAGYKIFGAKASNSTALVELKQFQEITLSDLVSASGEEDLVINCDGVVFSYGLTTGKVEFSGSLKTNDEGKTFTEEIKKKITDADSVKGTFNYIDGVIVYTTSNGMGKAIWKSGESPKKASNN